MSCASGGRRRRLDWNLPDASAEVLRNGWLHTGDLGREDRDGLIFFVDRQKDMVKPGGENVYSIEVEAVLTSHPAVVECAVIGVPDDRWGEAVKAVVVARGDVTAEELDRWCLDRLAAFKRPRWYDFVAGLPRNATVKVVKPDLRAAHDPATSTRLPERTWFASDFAIEIGVSIRRHPTGSPSFYGGSDHVRSKLWWRPVCP
ncbi:class I adenylate-forming enzyme family protein, partial [Mycobacterium innocens]|uniref:class I adenylate-forming enzyme family protein n=1 Tax=Mycobacterium innocens TaxID=2341083 RepID=UPI0024478D7A